MTRVYEVVGMAVISVGGGKGGEEDAGRGMRQGQMSLQSTEQMLGWLLVLLAYVGAYIKPDYDLIRYMKGAELTH